jgi:hypothetical protein
MKAKPDTDEHDQWRDRILRALAELRGGDERLLGASGQADAGAPASDAFGASSARRS